MKFNLKDMLQNETPTNKWLVFDDRKEIIRTKSYELDSVVDLSKNDILTINKLIDFVRYSQDNELNKKSSLNNDYLRPAVGLAAPQIGINKNMFYIRIYYSKTKKIKEIAAINAKILLSSAQVSYIKNGEGCLSVKNDYKGYVPRKYKIKVQYFDYLLKQNITEFLTSYEAIVFQHEFDHINGKLYYDHINKDNKFYNEEEWISI